MKKLGQKMLSLALAFALVITMMPAVDLEAFAANEVLAASETPSKTWAFSGGDFKAVWDEARKYSDDNDGALAYIVLMADAVPSSLMEMENDSNILLDLNGYTLRRDLAKESTNGHLFYMWDDAKLKIIDSSEGKTGKITGGKHNYGYGGAFYLYESSQVIIDGVEISENLCRSYGGAFYMEDSSRLTLNNARILGNHSDYEGGAIYVEDSASVTITGGTLIERNTSGYGKDYLGAAICCINSSDLFIDGAVIKNNSGSSGKVGGIYWGSNGDCHLVNATITDNSAAVAGGVYADAGWLDSDIILGGNVVIENNGPNNLYLIDEDANINNYTDNPLTTTSRIGVTYGEAASDADDCITASDSMFTDESLNCFFSDVSGYIIRKVDQKKGDNRWALYVTKEGDAQDQKPLIVSGSLEKSYAYSPTPAEPNTAQKSITLTTKSDLVTKRYLQDAPLKDFASFRFVTSGTVILEDDVKHNFVDMTVEEGGQTSKGVTRRYRVRTPNGTFEDWDITIQPNGVWPQDPVVAAVIYSGIGWKNFTNFNEAWDFAMDMATIDEVAKKGASLILYADWLAGDDNSNGYYDVDETPGYFGGGGDYDNFTSSGALYARSQFTNNTFDLTIDLNGHRIDRGLHDEGAINGGYVFYVDKGKLTIIDNSEEKGGRISGANNSSYGGAILTTASATVVLQDIILNGNRASTGPAIFSRGNLQMTNVTVNGNTATDGGIVHWEAANGYTFTMQNGSIRNNLAINGGGLYIAGGKGTVNMTGTQVSHNVATNDGGGIYVRSSGKINLSQVTMDGNSAARNGGAICFESGSSATMTLSNGSNAIQNNRAANGGGVYLDGSANMILSQASILENKASNHGGGFYLAAGSAANVTMDDSSNEKAIRNNSAISGGGIYHAGNGTFTIKNGEVIGNSATANGGGAYISSGDLILENGTISQNKTSAYGGAIAAEGSGSFKMVGGSIESNTSDMDNGVGGIYWNSTGIGRLSGGIIQRNDPYGVYVCKTDAGKLCLGGDIKIRNNFLDGSLYLSSTDVRLYHDTEIPLTKGAEIWVDFPFDAYDGNNGRIQMSAPDGGFAERSYEYFRTLFSGIRISNVDTQDLSEANRWQIYLVQGGSSKDQRATITGATVKGMYSADIEAEIDTEDKMVILHVHNDSRDQNKIALSAGNVSLYDIADFDFEVDGTVIEGGEEGQNFVTNRGKQYRLRTPNGNYDYWTIQIWPDRAWGSESVISPAAWVWVEGQDGARDFQTFEEAWIYVQEQEVPVKISLRRDWLAGDDNSNGRIEPSEESFRKFEYKKGDEEIGTQDGALHVSGGDITIDLDGHKIDRRTSTEAQLTPGNSSRVFIVEGGTLTITDTSRDGMITGGGGVIGTLPVDKGGAFYVTGANTTLNLEKGIISGNVGNSGGAIYITNEAKVNISGGSITGNRASLGGGIYVENGSLTVTGGSIDNNTAGYGGGVYYASGSFLMSGGSIDNNQAVAGGGIYVKSSDAMTLLTLRGGSVSGNYATQNGGAVYIPSSARALITGGQFLNNKADGRGGAIAFEKTAVEGSEISGAYIARNQAAYGGGISLIDPEFTSLSIRNVTLLENQAAVRGGGIDLDIDDKKIVQITGSTIEDNEAPEGSGIYLAKGLLRLVNDTIIENTSVKADGKSGAVHASGESDIELGGTVRIDENYVLTQSSMYESNLYLTDDNNDLHASISTPLASGSHIGISVGYDLGGDDADCLSHGESRFDADDGFFFHADSKIGVERAIALKDSGSGENNRYQIYIVNPSEEDGIPKALPAITGATAKYESFNGSGAFAKVDANNRTLTLTVNNTYKNLFTNLSLDTFANITTKNKGKVSGVEDLQNFVVNPSKIYQVKDGDWYSLWTIEVVPDTGVWSDIEGSVATVTTTVGTKSFYDIGMAYEYALAYSKELGGATLKLYQDWVAENFDYDEGTDSGRLYINDSKIDLTIDLNGFAIKRVINSAKGDGQIFKISNGVLTIMDSAGGGKITGGLCEDGGGAFYMNGGKLILESGEISGNTAIYGGALYMENKAAFIMNGGRLFNNCSNYGKSNYGGGAIYMEDDATFTMNGGEIVGNYASTEYTRAGAVYADDCTVFTMNGGSITGNASLSYGGAIYALDEGSVILNGGSITNNEGKYGGAVYWNSSGKLYLNDVEISGNVSTSTGGGVYVTGGGTTPYVGGTLRITDNKSENGANDSNVYLSAMSSNLRQNTGNRLKPGASIGIRAGYTYYDKDDTISSSDNYFDESCIAYFFSDDENYLIRIRVAGSGGNAYHLYLTEKNQYTASQAKAEIVTATVVETYASTYAPTFGNYVANIPVDPDAYYKMSNGELCLNDVVTLGYNEDARLVDEAVLDKKADLTAGVEIQVKAPDGLAVARWTVKVVPGNSSGLWNSYTVTLNNAVLANGLMDNIFHPGEVVFFKPAELENKAFRSWTTTDLHNALTTDEEGISSFTMPRNNVSVTAQYDNVINSADILLSEKATAGVAGPTTGTYIYNTTLQGTGDVSVAWTDSEGNPITGPLGFRETFTATVTIDLQNVDGCLVGDAPAVTIDGYPAVVTRVSDTMLQAKLDFTMPSAKVLSYAETIGLTHEIANNFTGMDTDVIKKLRDEVLPKTIPAVTEDPQVDEVKISWNGNISYRIDGAGRVEYILVQGTVYTYDNPELSFAGVNHHYVSAYVYAQDIVKTPIIDIDEQVSGSGGMSILVDMHCDTEDAVIYYTLDNTTPSWNENGVPTGTTAIYDSSNKPVVEVTSGTRKNLVIKAIGVKGNFVNSAAAVYEASFNNPYELTFTNTTYETEWKYTDNDGLYQNESTTIALTPDEGKWIKAVEVTGAAAAVNGTSVTISNPTGNVTITVDQQDLIRTIPLGAITLTPGLDFPSTLETGNGYTVTVDSWNTRDTKVAYGATYSPTVRVTANGLSNPFAPDLSMTYGETALQKLSQQTFKLVLPATAKARLKNVSVPGNITMNQGEVLTLPHAVTVTTEGGLISSASVTWTCTTEGGFNANAAKTYSFSGKLVLPANVDANGKDTFAITVTVNALPQLPMPSATSRVADLVKEVSVESEKPEDTESIAASSKQITVRSTIVELSYAGVGGATIYYTLDGNSPVDNEGNLVKDSEGNVLAKAFNPATGIILDETKRYTIKAVVHKENYTTSEVATFTYDITAPQVYTIREYSWVNGITTLVSTKTAIKGEQLTFVADPNKGFFSGWDAQDDKYTVGANGTLVPDNTWEDAFHSNNAHKATTLQLVMPAANVDLTGVYVAYTDTVNISGVDTPIAHKALDNAGLSTTTVLIQGMSAPYSVETAVAISWTPAETAVSGKTYTGTIVLSPDALKGVAYAKNVSVTGLTGATDVKAVTGEDGRVTITFNMKAAPAKMRADYVVGTGNVLTVANGTLEDAVKAQLPQKLTLSTEAGMIPVNVTWSCEKYDAATAGSYIFTADLSDAVLAANGIDRNGKTVSVKVTVKVEKPEVTFVAIPGVTVAAGSYSADKSVQLTCATQNAAIYYTKAINGTPADPRLSGSTLYTSGEVIPVNGTPGLPVSVVIMAAAKVGETWSEVATYRYTINLPAQTYAVTVTNGTISGSTASFKEGEAVTIVADAPSSGQYFAGWYAGEQLVSTNSTYTFTMPANDVSFTATYAEQKVTRVDIRVTEPVAGSELAATLSYDLTYNAGPASRNNSMATGWQVGVAPVIALRGSDYTLSVVLDEVFASDSPTITLNGQSIGSWDSQSKTFTYTWFDLKASYRSHVNPAPVVGVASGTAYANILGIPNGIPSQVSVAASDGTTPTNIQVDWTFPSATIGSGATVTITGKLNAAALDAADITGGTNEVVTIYVSSVARAQVAKPVAVPSPGTYEDSVAVQLSCATNNAVIYYTLDGSEPNTSSLRYNGEILLTQTTTVKAIAVQGNMENSEVETFTYTIQSTYDLTVVNGEGSGKYKSGTEVTVKANPDLNNYFTGWTVSGITLTDAERISETVTFEMPANAVSFTANYAPKVNLVEVVIADLELGKPLPVIDENCIVTGGVEFISGSWNTNGNVDYSTMYIANITIDADHGFAEHGDVKVNGKVVPSVMNEDGTVTLTYQVRSGGDSYVSHSPISVADILDIPNGTDLRTLEGDKLPIQASITTASGAIYTAAIKWDYSAYDMSSLAAQTVTITGEIILPTGVAGTNPTITAKVSVMARAIYTLTVDGGSGSGEYAEGAAVTITANEQQNKVFIGWSNGSVIVDTNSTYSFTMPAENLALTAVYADKVNLVEIEIGELVVGEPLPTIGASCVKTEGVSYIGGDWLVGGDSVVAGTVYIATITLAAEHGFAEHGDVKINGKVVPSVMNSNGTVTLTYQVVSSSESYVSHTPDFVDDIKDVPYGTDFNSLDLPMTATVTTSGGKTYAVNIKWNFSAYDPSITTEQTVTVTGEVILPAGITGTNPIITVNISILAQPVYTLTVDGGSGSGEYAEGTAVTITANELQNKAFIGWSNGSEIVSTSSTYSFNMPAEDLTLTATYGDKVQNVELTIGDLVVGQALPAITVTTSGVTLVRGGWTVSGNVESDTVYTAAMILQAEYGFAEQGVVKVNGDVVSFVVNNDETITVTYQALSGADSYVSHAPETLAPITGVANGTEFSTLVGNQLPDKVTITTTSGKTYPASILWDFSGYDSGDAAAQTFTATGEIILPAGITGTNPIITVDISVQAQPVSSLIVNGGSGSGNYMEGSTVTVTAGEVDYKYFTGWTVSGITLTDAELASETVTFIMPAGAVEFTANYAADSYASYEMVAIAPIDPLPHGTDLSTLVGNQLPDKATINTTSGKKYTASIQWSFSGYNPSKTSAQKVGAFGEILIPGDMNGQNPVIYKEISVLAKPAAPVPPGGGGGGGGAAAPPKPVVPEEPEEPEVPCDGGEGCISHNFADVNASAWYHEAVDYVVEKGMMNGVAADQFNPNGTTTRAMIVTILWRLEGSPVVNYAMNFQDVNADQWYTEAIRWAASEKIVEGWDGKFGANDAITREQFATILYRYEQYKGGGFDENWNFSLDYADKAEVSNWAQEAMCWMNMNKIINGKTGNVLDPRGSAIRAEAAAMLQRYCELETE